MRTLSASPGPEAGARRYAVYRSGLPGLTESTGEFRPETLVAIEAVKRAFAATRGGVAREEITIKEGRDLVTGADVAVEDVVRSVVGDTLGFPVIGEERGGRARPTARPTASSIQSVGRGTFPPESRCTA